MIGLVCLLGLALAFDVPLVVNRRFLLTTGLTPSNESALVAFQSAACRGFYVDAGEPLRAGWRPMALEDLHKGGRYAAFEQGALYQEVVASLEWKFAYVVVRKSLSQALTIGLKQLFGADWFWCRERCAHVGACFTANVGRGRCTTMALNGTDLRDFFFFSFVREPTERWFSQYAQAHVMWRLTHTRPTIEAARATLLDMGERAFVTEHHLQTQTFSLTSATADGTAVPLHFIGRAETSTRDWEYVVRQIWQRSGIVDHATRAVEPLRYQGHHEAERDQFVAALRPLKANQSLLQLIREVYTQDYVCFGY